MQQIFINSNKIIDNRIRVEGNDAKHLIKVCRIKIGEEVRVSTSSEENYLCKVSNVGDNQLELSIVENVPTTELPCRIRLYQAIPKGDRMETIIEKCTELGVSEIIPVEMKYSVVKLDDKKKAKKTVRYQSIAQSAAKQSKRSVIPRVKQVMTFKEAIEDSSDSDIIIVPYENKNGMEATTDALTKLNDNHTISIFIGPEGGFDSGEIEALEKLDKSEIVSLGKRILRTDTAAITTVAMVMLEIERAGICHLEAE